MQDFKEMTLKDVLEQINELIKENGEDILNKKVYLGDDEELNGVHECYFVSKLSKKNPEDIFTYNYTNGLENEKEDIILFS